LVAYVNMSSIIPFLIVFIFMLLKLKYSGVTNWRRKTYQEYYQMYTLQPCRHCNDVYKNCLPGVSIMKNVLNDNMELIVIHVAASMCPVIKVIWILMSQFSYESSRLCWKRKTRRNPRLLLGKHPSRVLQ